MRKRSVPFLVLPVVVLLAACESDGPTDPARRVAASMTVDATSDSEWVHVALGETAQEVSVADPATSGDWDLAFQTTKVIVNGGTNGPGGIVVHCLCQNADATSEALMAMTPASERAAFDAVTAADIPPAGAAWSPTALTDQSWYRYNLTGSDHLIWPTYDVYLIKRGDAVYKLQITGYYSTQGDPRHVTFLYEKLAG